MFRYKKSVSPVRLVYFHFFLVKVIIPCLYYVLGDIPHPDFVYTVCGGYEGGAPGIDPVSTVSTAHLSDIQRGNHIVF